MSEQQAYKNNAIGLAKIDGRRAQTNLVITAGTYAADVQPITITVKDLKGKPVSGAHVELWVVNASTGDDLTINATASAGTTLEAFAISGSVGTKVGGVASGNGVRCRMNAVTNASGLITVNLDNSYASNKQSALALKMIAVCGSFYHVFAFTLNPS